MMSMEMVESQMDPSMHPLARFLTPGLKTRSLVVLLRGGTPSMVFHLGQYRPVSFRSPHRLGLDRAKATDSL